MIVNAGQKVIGNQPSRGKIMANVEDGIVTGNCEIESCNEKATSYDSMDNKLCDEHWEQNRQEELEGDHNAE